MHVSSSGMNSRRTYATSSASRGIGGPVGTPSGWTSEKQHGAGLLPDAESVEEALRLHLAWDFDPALRSGLRRLVPARGVPHD